ncbi:uncharacterized protein LOC112085179 [Eutrema salsugineum]|uniref:uncharacterized protein LOC112085179 n=1 Tax=Eutrema salsugineum TaxID=72664 RepID=UPI000CED0D99|nr:uncharacterized protein LOC112085179 [Eutrema salsugineum]
MDINEAREFPPHWLLWWESGNYSRSMHELITGVGICELFLAWRWTNDRDLICFVVHKMFGRLSHAFGSFIILSLVFELSDDQLCRYMGILFFVYCLVVLSYFTTSLDDEHLLDDIPAEHISQIRWWGSKEFGRTMYEIILGANLALIAHYHIKIIKSLLYFFILFLVYFHFEFRDISLSEHVMCRSYAQLIGLLTASYFIYHRISQVFGLGLITISIICHIGIIAINCYEAVFDN